MRPAPLLGPAPAPAGSRRKVARAAPVPEAAARAGVARVAVVSTLFPPIIVGGAERTVEILARGLAERGIDVHVITTDPAEDGSARAGPLTVHRVRLRNLYWPYPATSRRPLWQRALWHSRDIHNAAMGREVARLLGAIRPDVVLTFNIQGFSTSAWRAAGGSGLPLVHVIQDYWLLCPRTTMFSRSRNCEPSCHPCRLVTANRRRQTRSLDAVIGVSRAVLQRHREEGLFEGVPIQRIIHNSRRSPGHRAPGPTRRAGLLRVGFLGRVSREKGFDYLLDEIARFDEAEWILLVGGRLPAEVRARVESHPALPRTIFLGFIEPERFFEQVDVLVVPSLWREPLAGVVIEAMGHGVPVIASSRGGLPELLEGPAAGGYVFDPGTPGSLRRLLGRLAREPELARQLGALALEQARRFTVQRQVGAYAALLDEVVAGRRAGGTGFQPP